MDVWFQSLLTIFLISLLSLVGALALFLNQELLKKLTLFLVAFAAGALLGDALIHLIPHLSQELGLGFSLSGLILTGFLLFFVLEKFLKWRHCHRVDCDEHYRALGVMNLIADGLHNFIDGALIAASFNSSLVLGRATALAVGFHELPQEIGDFAVLIHSGFSRSRALVFNFFSAAAAFLGAVLVLSLSQVTDVTHFLLPITAGGFIYIAASGLIPQLHEETSLKKSALQFFGLLLGMGVMAALLLLE